MAEPPSPAAAHSPFTNTPPYLLKTEGPSIDFNIIVVIAAVICAIVCGLGLNSMLRCILQCACRVLREPFEWASGRTNSGLRTKDMVALPVSVYASFSSSALPSSFSVSSCAICLAEFCGGDVIRVLPKCNHGFHAACIDKWLQSHSSCLTCRIKLTNPK